MAITQGGNNVPLSTAPGVDAWGQLTTMPYNDGLAATNGSTAMSVATSGTTSGNPTARGNPPTVYYLVAFLMLLVIIKYVTEHERSKMDVHFLGIGVYNWIASGLMATTFIVCGKAILNKYYVRGVTEIFNAA